MSEITNARTGELIRGVFRVLKEHPDGLRAKEVLARLEQIVPPTEFESGTYPAQPNVRRYEKIIRLSTIAPVKAGWLSKSKGLWSLTDAGIAAFEQYPDPVRFSQMAGRLYREWKQGQPAEEVGTDVPSDARSAVTTLEEAEEAAWAEIEGFLETMNPYDFQDLVAGLLHGMGYFVDYVAPPGPDRGIDIVAHTDPLGVEGPRIKVQVKRRKDKAAVDAVRGFMAVMGDGDVGLFVCTGGFTRDAMDEARRQEKRRIMLVDLKRLFDLWTEHYEEIPDAQRRLLPLRPIYYLDPED